MMAFYLANTLLGRAANSTEQLVHRLSKVTFSPFRASLGDLIDVNLVHTDRFQMQL